MSKQKNTNSPKKRIFIYFSGRILIKSNIKLTKMQKNLVFKIVKDNLANPFYGFERYIARQIFYELGSPVSYVKFCGRIGFCVEISA